MGAVLRSDRILGPAESCSITHLGARKARASECAERGASDGQDSNNTGLLVVGESPNFEGFLVDLYQGRVVHISLYNDPRYATTEGLHVGSTEGEIRAALGEPTDVQSIHGMKTLYYASRCISTSRRHSGRVRR